MEYLTINDYILEKDEPGELIVDEEANKHSEEFFDCIPMDTFNQIINVKEFYTVLTQAIENMRKE